MYSQNIKDKENITYIESVSDFLKKIKNIGAKGKEALFYRGHANEETFNLTPTIYRNNKFIQNEHKIYRETIAKVPYDFNGKNTIESLVLMQHYGVPTRILDLTTNPLVALYFACDDNNHRNADGEVIVFDIPEESTCYFDSDKVTILANLAKCKSDFYYEDGDMPRYKKYIKELENKSKTINIEIGGYIKTKKNIIEKIKNYIEKNKYFFINSKDIDNQINKIISIKNSDICLENYDQLSSLVIKELERETKKLLWKERLSINDEYFGELLHLIKQDKSYFQNIINPDDVRSVFAIKPKLDNPRIVRQYGAFLIFGAKENNKEMPEVESSWVKRGEKSTSKERLIIKSSEKKSILDELDNLGINKSTLFPEIDKVAEYIKDKIMNNNYFY